MSLLTRYSLKEKIYESHTSVVYRAVRHDNLQSVIVKRLPPHMESVRAVATLKYEYEIAHSLNSPRVIQVYEYEDTMLVMEDMGGESLQQVLAQRSLTLEEFLHLALQLAEGLGHIHQREIIHKDLNPANMIYNPVTRQIKITDFGIAALFSRENPALASPSILQGTMPYISPEQTGRMNRPLDYRSDFYSLGITFYEMLVGWPPFQSRDPAEMLHAHIARVPTAPHIVDPQIPRPISDIVMKMLAKTAEERYQSAYGLRFDLDTCLRQLQGEGQIGQLLMGLRDRAGQFQISSKLYGRGHEVGQLLQTFDRVCERGRPELLLVSGYSGIGKTTLVNEIHKPITQQRGYFISGKFDQLRRDVPYASIIQAFQDLIRQLLAEASDALMLWRATLLEALGENGQIIIDVIPEIEMIVGRQPPAAVLGPHETQRRFELVFNDFISVFSRSEHPLVLFLDDLHWADSASLRLIELMLSGEQRRFMLVIGAYRDNEIVPGEPLTLAMDRLLETEISMGEIHLQPLEAGHVAMLLSDSFNTAHDKTQGLAELLVEKTGGNPFFLTQLIRTLYAEGLINFDFGRGEWIWDLNTIRDLEIANNVIDLMVYSIKKLPEATQAALKLAACIGSSFDLSMLAIVTEKSARTTAGDLSRALQSGLLLSLNDSYRIPVTGIPGDGVTIGYRFLHDRVQQAAYSMIPEAQRQHVHLKVGRLLLQHMDVDELAENLFDVVNHLNFGATLIDDTHERQLVNQLNLQAARKARRSTAYEAAFHYIQFALSTIEEEDWTRDYDFALAVYEEALEIEYLNAHLESLDALAEPVLRHARSLLDQMAVYKTQIKALNSQNRMSEAIDLCLSLLARMEINLLETPPLALLDGSMSVDDLIALPRMTDPLKRAAMQILMLAGPPTYLTRPELFPSIGYTMVDLCRRYGNSELAPYAYGIFGLTMGGAFKQIDMGYQFGKLAFQMLDVVDAREIKAQIHEIFDVHIRHWKEPLRLSPPSQIEGIHAGLATGQVEYTTYLAAFYLSILFFSGERLTVLEHKQAQQIALLEKLKIQFSYQYALIWEQVIANLHRSNSDPTRLAGDYFNEDVMVPHLKTQGNATLLASYYVAKTMLLYLFGRYQDSIDHAEQMMVYEPGVMGMNEIPRRLAYHTLALLGRAIQTGRPVDTTLEQVEVLQRQLGEWAAHGPMNFQHLVDLVEAEKARLLGSWNTAMEHYDRAIDGAHAEGYLQDDALANELAAQFYFGSGRVRVGQIYLQDAHQRYVEWGAVAKVEQLERQYPNLISPPKQHTQEAQTIGRPATSTRTQMSGFFDLSALVEGLQTISSEITLDRLLSNLMAVVLKNAGAQRGALILDRGGALYIEARVDSEDGEHVTLYSQPLIESTDLSQVIIKYVAKTRENVVLEDAMSGGLFVHDVYVRQNHPRSVLCVPIQRQERLTGILYLENNLMSGAFTPDRIEILQLLTGQMAISLENARLYEHTNILRAEAEKANELKIQFLGMISHELRTPLTSIKGFTSTILAPDITLPREQEREFIGIIDEEADKLTELVEQLLEVSRIQAGNLRIYADVRSVSSIVEVASNQLKTLTRQHRFTVDLAPNLPPVLADDQRIAQVLANLVGNAVKYSEAGTAIQLRARAGGDRVVFTVSDEGIGIPLEAQPFVFEAFRQVENKGRSEKGAGLGLAICKGLIEAHGGELWIENRPGPGTTLMFTLLAVPNQDATFSEAAASYEP